jgi:RNA polymerase sigma-70 factor (ECF subfamily)
MVERTNQEWLSALRGPERDQALADLRALLMRGLGYALAGHPDVCEADLEDFVQEALLKILAGLDSFRGESRFITWAQKIVVRIAFTEMRRRRWHDVSLEDIIEASTPELISEIMAGSASNPEKKIVQSALLNTLRQTIVEELTERQRQALVAVLHGMPLEEVARRMGSNRNALYKLLHDARQRLKNHLLARGWSLEDVLNIFGE